MNVMGPTLTAHPILRLAREREPVPTRGFHQMNGSGIENGWRMVLGLTKKIGQMLLGLQTCCTALCLL